MSDSIQDKPFEVQAGKRYVRRDGGISGVLIPNANPDKYFIFMDLDVPAGCGAYGADGGYYSMANSDYRDLISEYIEPTAEPQWGPWIGWNGGRCPVDDVKVQVHAAGETRAEAEVSDVFSAHEAGWHHIEGSVDNIIAYRIKKEPVVTTDTVWIALDTGAVYDCDSPEYRATRKAVITLTDGKPSIEWADE